MPSSSSSISPVVPARSQPDLPLEKIILTSRPGSESIPMDVVFVGAGPAGLAGAIELARLVRKENEQGSGPGSIEIAVLEKAEELGQHSLSGALINPRAFHELFPELEESEFPFRKKVEKERVFFLTASHAFRLPTPPTMRNHGFYVASLCEIVRWLGERATELGINIFSGFPADSLLVEGDRVIGVRTTPAGLNRAREPASGYMPPTDVTARVTVLAEGTRGMLSQAYLKWQEVKSDNPQIFALGVKELWETRRPLDAVLHTLGWPLPSDTFGGSFMYPMKPNLVSLGIVVGLDYPSLELDVHVLLQQLKLHPLFRGYLEGGELLEWGAKTIPEGGYGSVPKRRHGNGIMILGDSVGFVDVPSLKGIHYAMQSGIYAARAIFSALKKNDTSAQALEPYDQMVNDSFIMKDLYRTRNMRLAFKKGIYAGGIRAALMTLTRGALSGRRIAVERDADTPRRKNSQKTFSPDGKLTFRKVDAVFRSGNTTRDDIPSHLIVGENIPSELAEFYQHMCPAGVFERDGDRLVINSPNCIDCKATDVLGPRWTPREGGSGPRYRRM